MCTSAPIKLDYTLRDLYDIDNEDESYPTLAFCPVEAKDCAAFSPKKFIYHYGLRTAETVDNSWLALALKILPQRHGFMAGKMPMVVLDLEVTQIEPDIGFMNKVDISLTFSRLRHDQRPTVSFTTDPSQVPLKPGSPVAIAMPSDCVSHLPHLIDPVIHYEILSKRWLALAGLPTPPSAVIDPLLQPDCIHNSTRLESEIAHMTASLDTYAASFVAKLPQTVSGKGVFFVSSEDDRAHVKGLLGVQLQEMLAEIHSANLHLYPCSLVLQDYIPGAAVGLSIFVTRKGRGIFIACCEQQFNKRGHWVGGSISYQGQAALQQKFDGLTEEVARCLHRKGYYGPVGLDVITNASGEHFIVDLNARVMGTYHLGPLTNHFAQRGLSKAAVVLEYFTCPRAAFEEAFADEIRDGSLIITGWTHGESMRLSHGFLTVGGSDSSEMEKILEKVKAHVIQEQ
ncbi:ATP-grasp domain-containing protein [Hirsutella rhossiliensis]|uniref:ATP-grasp domain-containing protein n=1 Tax=Hirsutella rhossiliensis TaxID=111463 RepID=A0A9P8N9K3_9HYPO|nr:ATP-grasp domain-containing protein [Hirsutella rhossiliensis]KAH0967122.1 ATP-grasp domain-containing protein [Hirsutella rhossiliensis]